MNNKWNRVFGAMLVTAIILFFRQGITPATIIAFLAVGVVAFIINSVIESQFGSTAAADKESAGQSRLDSPPGPPSPTTGAAVSPEAIASGQPRGVPLTPVAPGAITAEPMAMTPIPLAPPKPAPPVAGAKKDAEQKDTIRELIETIVFVVVLVLMLKTFLAEAFVIPTGSMADTLLGYHHKINCTQCGFPDLVNASDEADPPPQRGGPQSVVSCQCPNCGFTIEMPHARRPLPRGGQP